MIGKHLILDLFEVKEGLLDNSLPIIISQIKEILEKEGHKIQNISEHIFDNGAYTLLFLLMESHFSVHTWPENGYIAVDCFSCKKTINMEFIKDELLKVFNTNKFKSEIINRG